MGTTGAVLDELPFLEDVHTLAAKETFRQRRYTGILCDTEIAQLAKNGMIEPFALAEERKGVVSYGVSSYGYDFRVADEFRIFKNTRSVVIDPKAFSPESFDEFQGDVCIIPPNSFALARTVEYWRVPRDIIVVSIGKSTYARCGIILNTTPFEPQWEGYATLEISNTTPLPAKIYANEGIGQALFFRSDLCCKVSYSDKKGKYQGQQGITLAKVK